MQRESEQKQQREMPSARSVAEQVYSLYYQTPSKLRTQPPEEVEAEWKKLADATPFSERIMGIQKIQQFSKGIISNQRSLDVFEHQVLSLLERTFSDLTGSRLFRDVALARLSRTVRPDLMLGTDVQPEIAEMMDQLGLKDLPNPNGVDFIEKVLSTPDFEIPKVGQ